MSQANDIRNTFFQECDDLLEALEDGLGQIDAGLASGAGEDDTVNAVFRAVHSIKGGAAAFGLDKLVTFAHGFENVLDAMRARTLPPDAAVIRLCFRAADHLADLVRAGRDNVNLEPSAGAVLAEQLAALVAGPDTALAEKHGFVPLAIGLDLPAGSPEPPGRFTIRFTPTSALYASGNDPALLLRALAELGDLTSTVEDSALPPLEELVPETSYLGWTLMLETFEGDPAIREVFEFVEGLCRLEISRDPPPVTAAPQSAPLAGPAPPHPSSPAAAAASPRPRATVRVNLDQVDRLINLVGELVINQAVLAQCVDEAGLHDRGDLATRLDEFRNLARDIQDSVMAIRAQPVKPLFQRMARILREASDLAGKPVRLMTEGDSTEIDKTLIERLVDPLTHMIRNAVDHGLETPAARRATGKPEIGQVTLSAAHRSGRVVIEVADDGAGINRPRVFRMAAEKGLIAPDTVLNEAEIDNLLFLPGFSTAPEVSNLSGRGVGMDVVRSAIQKLGGRVSLRSRPGHGTTLSISLPLTLAVLDGMVVEVAGQTMVVPLSAIVETLRPRAGAVHPLGRDNQVVSVRNRLVPIIDLGVVFGQRRVPAPVADMVLLLVEAGEGGNWALAVDRIFDQRQVLIKGLEANCGPVPGVAAATILGDGNIALIIDPEDIARRAAPAVARGARSALEEAEP